MEIQSIYSKYLQFLCKEIISFLNIKAIEMVVKKDEFEVIPVPPAHDVLPIASPSISSVWMKAYSPERVIFLWWAMSIIARTSFSPPIITITDKIEDSSQNTLRNPFIITRIDSLWIGANKKSDSLNLVYSLHCLEHLFHQNRDFFAIINYIWLSNKWFNTNMKIVKKLINQN